MRKGNALRSGLRRLLSILLILTLFYSCVLEIRIGNGGLSIALTDSPLIMRADAVSSDPLAGIAALNGGDAGKTVSDYAEINSAYQLTGYDTPYTTGTSFISDAGKHGTYRTVKNGRTENSWAYDYYGDQPWAQSGSTEIAVTDNTHSADGDYVPGFIIALGNANASAKVNGTVLQIKAKETISISFDYSVHMKFTSGVSASDTAVKQQAFFYYLITDSPTPTVGDMQKNGTKVVDGSSSSGAGADFKLTIEKGEYLYLYFCGFVCIQQKQVLNYKAKYEFSASVSNFTVTPSTENYTLTLGSSDCADNKIGSGKLSVNNVDCDIPGSGYTTPLENVPGGTRVNLSVGTTPSGYIHIGWRNKTTGEDVFAHDYSFALDSDMEVYALFVPKVTVTMGSSGLTDASYSYKLPNGNDQIGADQYVARNSAASKFYKTLAEAFGDTDIVVLIGNITLNGDFTIPVGKTLSVPWDLTEDPATSMLQTGNSTASVSVYTSAAINGTVTLEGSLVASGVQSNASGANGRACGKVGQFIINGLVNVSSTGTVYAYGMITGQGNIAVASGGNVYELMEIRDMRAFDPLQTVVTNKKAFPFNHYFVKANEVATIYTVGGKLTACYYVNVNGIKSSGTMLVIGTTSDPKCMFKIASGSLTKDFSSSAPYNNKTIFRAESGSDIQTGSFSISMKVASTPISINTSDYYLPLNYCFAIEVADGGSFTLNDNYKMLPGALVNVMSGGTFIIASGKNLVLYRANDYDFRRAGTPSQGFSSTGYPTAFTKPTGLSYASNTAASVGSAIMNVDGTLFANGGLYVTNKATGDTTYANGYNYLTGTGKVQIQGAQNSGTIDEWTQEGNTSVSSVSVNYDPIKGLTKYDIATDDHQTDYTSFSTAGTRYGWINSSGVNIWYTTATISYDSNGGTGTAPESSSIAPGGSFITAESTTFSKPDGEFAGWNTAADGSGTSYNPGESVTVTQAMGPVITLYAQWKIDPTVTPPTALTLTYNGSAQVLIGAAATSGGTLLYSTDNSTWSESLPTGTDAGTYTVYYKVEGNNNYKAWGPEEISVTISKAASSVTNPPMAKMLTYDGTPQSLITAGEASGGTMQYRLGLDGVYSPAIPTATEAGSYTVYYKVVGDSNHNDSAEESVTVTISNIISVTVTWDDLSYTYTYGTWQPESHTYDDDTLKWNGATEAQGNPRVTITNQSQNVDLEAKLAYANTNASFSGSFSAVGGTALANGNTVSLPTPTDSQLESGGNTYVVEFALTGTLDRGAAAGTATVGTITVTISKPTP